MAGTAGRAGKRPFCRKTLLVLGDSLSAEYGLPRGKGWVALLDARLQTRHPGWQVNNASISGETTAGGKSRLPALLKQHQPAIVIIELGGNDALRGLALQHSENNLREMVQASKQSGAAVLILGMRMPPNYGSQYTEKFSALFAQVAQQEKPVYYPSSLIRSPTNPNGFRLTDSP
jgi:acyl-CoA thioesterase-1